MALTDEELQEFLRDGIPVAQAAKRLLSGSEWSGATVTPRSVFRWMRTGILVNGTRHKLAGARVGGRWVTTTRHLREFVARTSNRADAESNPHPSRSPAERRRAVVAADRRNAQRAAKV